MALKRIEARNFKSFRALRLELNDLNVLVGSNGAGKSNVLSLLRFIRDAASLGLEDAVSLQGGIGYLTNLSLSDHLELKMTLTPDSRIPERPTSTDHFRLQLNSVDYHLILGASNANGNMRVIKDDATLGFDVFRQHEKELESLGKGRIRYHKVGEKVERQVRLPAHLQVSEVFTTMSDFLYFGNPELFPVLFTAPEALFGPGLASLLPSTFDAQQWLYALPRMGIFDLNVKLPKQVVQINARSDLEEDGSNLAIVLRRILADESQRQMLTSLLHYVLPFVTGVETEQYADRFLLLKLRESYGEQALPASLLSDGTIYVVALIVALYFSRRSVVAIEEPEKHIHPYLLARVAELLKDAAQNTPVIVTTQNPELVRHVDLRSLLLVTRDQEGFSTIRQPAKSEEVQHFLHNEIGIADLFTQNLLGI